MPLQLQSKTLDSPFALPSSIYKMSNTSPTSFAGGSITPQGLIFQQPILTDVHPAFRTNQLPPNSKESPESYPKSVAMKDESRRDSGIGRLSVSSAGSMNVSGNTQSISLNAILETSDTSSPPSSPSGTGRKVMIPLDKIRSFSLEEVPRWRRRHSASSPGAQSLDRERSAASNKTSYFPSVGPAHKPTPSRPSPLLITRKDENDAPISPLTRFDSKDTVHQAPSMAEDALHVSPYYPDSPKLSDEDFYSEHGETSDEFVYPRPNKYEYPIETVDEEDEYSLNQYIDYDDFPKPPKTPVAHNGAAAARSVPDVSIPGSLVSLQSTTPSAFKAHPGQRVRPGEVPVLSRWSTDDSSNGSSNESQANSRGKSAKGSRRKQSAGTGARPRLLSMLKSGNPLILAAKSGDHAEVYRILGPGTQLNVIASADKDGMTALHWAAREGHVDAARALLLRQAPLEARTKSQERTALFFAAQAGHVKLVDMLVAAGADVESAGKFDGATALHKASQNGHEEVVSILLRAGADVNHRDIEGMPPIMWATQGNKLGTARLLLGHGADLEIRIMRGKNLELASREGLTVLFKVVDKKDHHSFVRAFLEAGANANTEGPFGFRPLHRAACLGDQTNTGMLIEFNADITAETNEGWTPLHCAARYGMPKVYHMLVRAGADEDHKNHAGLTARELGKTHGHSMDLS